MTFILISGRTNTGKTETCNRLHGMLGMNETFRFLSREHTVGADHLTHYEKGGKQIVINSSSDSDERMLEFAKYLDELAKDGVRPDIIVTTIRETDEINYQMSHMIALLEAIAAGTPSLGDYYNQNISEKSPAELAPMPQSLSHNAFVLHLEKRSSKNTAALSRYLNANASKVYDMLDFVLARL